jgi:hypothetical protein
VLLLYRNMRKQHLSPIHPFRLVASQSTTINVQPLADGNLRHVDILHHRPNDGQTTGFRGEGIDLVRSLPNIAKEAFDGVGCANIAVHDRWESVKRQQMLFIFAEAADGFGIALLVFGFKSCQIEQRILLLLLLEDPSSFRADLFAFPMSNGVEDIALFMHHTALPGSG